MVSGDHTSARIRLTCQLTHSRKHHAEEHQRPMHQAAPKRSRARIMPKERKAAVCVTMRLAGSARPGRGPHVVQPAPLGTNSGDDAGTVSFSVLSQCPNVTKRP